MISSFSPFENICVWTDERSFVFGNRETCHAITWKSTYTLKLKFWPSPWEKNKLKRAVLFCFEKNLKFQEWIIRENHSCALQLFFFFFNFCVLLGKTLTLTTDYSFLLSLCNSKYGHALMAVAHRPLSLASVSCGFRNSWLGTLFLLNDTPTEDHEVPSLGPKRIYEIIFSSNYDSIYFLHCSFWNRIVSSWNQPR